MRFIGIRILKLLNVNARGMSDIEKALDEIFSGKGFKKQTVYDFQTSYKKFYESKDRGTVIGIFGKEIGDQIHKLKIHSHSLRDGFLEHSPHIILYAGDPAVHDELYKRINDRLLDEMVEEIDNSHQGWLDENLQYITDPKKCPGQR